MDKFPCTSCGLCCKNAKRIMDNNPATKQMGNPLYFPYQFDNKGACTMLKNDLCTIYDNRPLICNIDAIIKTFKLSKSGVYRQNATTCNMEIKKAGLDKKFLIKIDEL